MPALPLERAILVGLDLKGRGRSGASRRGGVSEPIAETAEESMDELAALTESAGGEIIDRTIQSRDSAEAATLIGSGKVQELAEKIKAFKADLVIFDRDLTPTQQRNLDRDLHCKVLDRTQLILDIFARRARTREGQLQVELAQLNYLLPRLSGHGVEMSRLGGGIGTRGPGETQLETDRRMIFRRIRKIEDDLESVRAGRTVQRRQRQAVPLATIGLVGYTNAGKSTLFNRFTGADVLADAKMFATLDPTVRQMRLPSNRRVLLSDTVGFIRNLPTTLVKAFRATLEEVVEASLLLHVVDVSSPQAAQQTAHVLKVLAEIGAASTLQIIVFSKLDLLAERDLNPDVMCQRVLGNTLPPESIPQCAAVSARTGEGFDKLQAKIDALLPVDLIVTVRFRFPHSEGAAASFVHDHGRVLETHHYEEYSEIVAEVPESVKRRFAQYLERPPDDV